ncbi:MAG: 50S ribosomal protein L10 [Bdellovibrio sp.]
MLKRSEKEEIIAGLKKDFETAKGVFLTNLIGISSNDAVALRKEIRENNGKVVVTKNTLFQKAAAGTFAEKLMSTLKGPSALAFAFDDAAAVAKSLKKAGETFELVQLRGGFLEGKELSLNEVKQLADLPSKEQMLGTLLATFNAPVSAFVRVVEAIREKKEKGEITA